MSHLKEREEKICLNCHAVIYGKYCHICGQENIEPKETFWGLLTHFVYDITHFDGKFFSTLKYLLLKPGYLSKAFMQGRRASYLHPIKMYVFTSAFFFVFFFAFINTIDDDLDATITTSASEVRRTIDSSLTVLKANQNDPTFYGAPQKKVEQKIAAYEADLIRLKTDTTNLNQLNYFKDKGNLFGANQFKSIDDYTKAQTALPPEKRDVWLIRQLRIRELEMRDKYGNDSNILLKKLLDTFFHQFPQMLFVSLPIFALLLQIIYIRHRKLYFYADHAIYAVHLYVAMFILLFLQLLAGKLSAQPFLHWLNIVSNLIVVYMFYYQYRSLRFFYGQGRFKTILKYILLLLFNIFLFAVLFIVFFLLSVFLV